MRRRDFMKAVLSGTAAAFIPSLPRQLGGGPGGRRKRDVLRQSWGDIVKPIRYRIRSNPGDGWTEWTDMAAAIVHDGQGLRIVRLDE